MGSARFEMCGQEWIPSVKEAQGLSENWYWWHDGQKNRAVLIVGYQRKLELDASVTEGLQLNVARALDISSKEIYIHQSNGIQTLSEKHED